MNIKFNLKDSDTSFILLCFLPAALVTGPLLSEIIINFISIVFVYDVFKNKKFNLFKNIIFAYFFIFFLYLLITGISSDIFNKIAPNVLFYFRFILFSFAICEILKSNKKYLNLVFVFLSLTIFIVIVDGYIQLIFDENTLGFPKYRIDRISGFFNDDLILGSYLFRLLPFLIGLTFFFKEKSRYFYYFNILLISLTAVLILFTGERASFLLMMISLILIFIQISLSKKIKFILSVIGICIVGLSLTFNNILFDRLITQFKNHIISKDKKTFMPYYLPMFETSYKMFKEKKLIGFGPKSFRYYCNDERFVTYFPNSKYTIDNTRIDILAPWNQVGYLELNEVLVKKGDVIQKGDKLFSFNYTNEKKINYYLSDKEGVIKSINIYEDFRYQRDTTFAYIKPLFTDEKTFAKRNSCNTHPHNTYVQLLAETGIIGFLFVFVVFCFLSIKILQNIMYSFFYNKKILSDLEACILVGFFTILWPLTTSGNFFNNWLNIINFYPLGFYLYIYNNKNDIRSK